MKHALDSVFILFTCLYLFGVGKSKARQPKKLRRKLPRAGSKSSSMMQQTRTMAQTKRGARGRVKKGKPKKTIKINGLDLLHSQTLLSTSPQGEY
jgi:H3 lysine-79-specific histone-lysine N-methyltransferase